MKSSDGSDGAEERILDLSPRYLSRIYRKDREREREKKRERERQTEREIYIKSESESERVEYTIS